MILRGILSLLYSLVFKNVQFILLRVHCQNRHMEPLVIAICLEFFFSFGKKKDGLDYPWMSLLGISVRRMLGLGVGR